MGSLKTEYQVLNNIQLAFKQYGNGPTLLLVHGNSESKRIFSKYQIKHFLDYHTYAIDSRCHGQSISIDNELSISAIADDIINFCKARSISEASIIGYSDGGNIALTLATKEPIIFKNIIAISPNYLVSGTEERTLKLLKRIYKIMNMLAQIGFNTKKAMLRFDLMLNDIGITDSDLRGIQTKVSIVYAEKDMIKEEHIKRIAELIPNSKMLKIQKTSHMNIYKNKQTIEIMRDILANNLKAV
jgi:phosphatidylglycerol lysyltransferase